MWFWNRSDQIDRIEYALHLLTRKVDRLMAIGVETQRVITEIDAETTRIATKFDELVTAADLTAEEKAAFTALTGRLKLIGADPENPVPPPSP